MKPRIPVFLRRGSCLPNVRAVIVVQLLTFAKGVSSFFLHVHVINRYFSAEKKKSADFFFLIFAQNIDCCGYTLEPHRRARENP